MVVSVGREANVSDSGWEYGIRAIGEETPTIMRDMFNRRYGQGNSLAAFLRQMWMIKRLKGGKKIENLRLCMRGLQY